MDKNAGKQEIYECRIQRINSLKVILYYPLNARRSHYDQYSKLFRMCDHKHTKVDKINEVCVVCLMFCAFISCSSCAHFSFLSCLYLGKGDFCARLTDCRASKPCKNNKSLICMADTHNFNTTCDEPKRKSKWILS